MSPTILLILTVVWLIGAFTIGKLLAKICVSIWSDVYDRNLRGIHAPGSVVINIDETILSLFLFPVSFVNFYIFGDSDSTTFIRKRYPPLVHPESLEVELFNTVTGYKIFIAFLWPIRLAFVPINMVWALCYLVGRAIGRWIYSYFD